MYYQTDQVRAEDESAVFGELYYQINDKMELTLGKRKFDMDTTFKGFVGTVWWPNYILGSSTRPDNVNSKYDGSDSISKINLSYQVDNNGVRTISFCAIVQMLVKYWPQVVRAHTMQCFLTKRKRLDECCAECTLSLIHI